MHRFWRMLKALADPNYLRVRPGITRSLLRYLRRFRLKETGNHLVIHSHLPPINSSAYRRFTLLHLIKRIEGPTHAQVGVTPNCPQKCGYCYNQGRQGTPLDFESLLKTVNGLKRLGVVWTGFTGGEPLLLQNLETLIESAAETSAVKIFTTGYGLSVERARSISKAGCFSIAVSLDHRQEHIHDAARQTPGAWQTALSGIRAALDCGNLHVSVSSVISPEMIQSEEIFAHLEFLRSLGIHEAWLSEPKPAAPRHWGNVTPFREEDRLRLIRIQDEANRKGDMTVNYLGHFEGAETFGCNAGRRMIYVDAWGEVSPCVFAPLSFGNVRTQDITDIYREMRTLFPPRKSCFVHQNHLLFRNHYQGRTPLNPGQSRQVALEAPLGSPSQFMSELECFKEAS